MWHPEYPEHYRDAIVEGDARALAESLPDESVDLIYTDPVYSKLRDYEWLGGLAARVLRPNGHMLVFCQERQSDQIKKLVARKDTLVWHWRANYILNGRGNRLFQYKCFNKCFPILLFGRPGRVRARRFWVDTHVQSNSCDWLPDAANHRWSKHPEGLHRFLDAFTDPEEVVLDPFSGGGSIPAVAKMFRRHYTGFEQDPAAGESARARLAATARVSLMPRRSWETHDPQVYLEMERGEEKAPNDE